VAVFPKKIINVRSSAMWHRHVSSKTKYCLVSSISGRPSSMAQEWLWLPQHVIWSVQRTTKSGGPSPIVLLHAWWLGVAPTTITWIIYGAAMHIISIRINSVNLIAPQESIQFSMHVHRIQLNIYFESNFTFCCV
jgi:hypothetical protein